MIPLSEIDVGARLRPAGDAHVEALAASIARGAEAGVGHEGLISPISLRARVKGEKGRPFVLISGYHRLKALIWLEREAAPAQVLAADAAEAELQEIEENLIRADLSVLDRALHVRKYRRIFEAAYGVVKAGRREEFLDSSINSAKLAELPVWSEAAKERLGLAGRTLDRLQKIAKLDDLSIARLQLSQWADNQKFLEEFVGVPPDMRPDVLDLLLDPENELSLREALAKVSGRPPEEERAKDQVWLEKAFGAVNLDAPKAWRRRFYGQMLMRDLDEVRAAAEAVGYLLTPKPMSETPGGED